MGWAKLLPNLIISHGVLPKSNHFPRLKAPDITTFGQNLSKICPEFHFNHLITHVNKLPLGIFP